MSEKTYVHPEKERPSGEIQDHAREELDKLIQEKGLEAKQENEQAKSEQLDELRNETQAEAISTDDLLARHVEQEQPAAAPGLVNKDLKEIKYKRTLQSVRKDLSKPERTLSKVIHNPLVDAVSSGAEKTVARPISLLTGAIFAFIGSSLYLFVVKHYGYEYNFLIFVLLFAAGFGLGLVVELILRLLHHSPKQ